MRRIENLLVKLVLGLATMIIGLVAANIALFQWTEQLGVTHLFGEYSKYVLGLSGFAATIFGTMLINDFWVLRTLQKGEYELPIDLIVRYFKGAFFTKKAEAPAKNEE